MITLKRLVRPLLVIAYRLALAYWFVFRPDGYGVYVAVWSNERVLIIKNSYLSEWTFPSGGLKAGESAATAAARELREEVGIAVEPEDLMCSGEFLSLSEFKRDHCTAFEIEYDVEPDFQVDEFEVVDAKFITYTELCDRRNEMTNIVRLYIDWKCTQQTASRSS